MDSTAIQVEPYPWLSLIYSFLAPEVQVKGRMGLLVLAAPLWAFSWLLYRAWQVMQIPDEVLVEKLGLDIPPEPDLVLENIACDSVQFSWKITTADTASALSTVQEFQIEVNGQRAATSTKKNELAAIVSNLMPLSYYTIRVFSSSGSFQTPSSPLHIRTRPAPADWQSDPYAGGLPQVRALTSSMISSSNTCSSTAVLRQVSEGHIIARRNTGRRPSISRQTEPTEMVEDSSEEVADLTQQFKYITEETASIEALIVDESHEQEHIVSEKEALLTSLRQQVKEQEETSSELRRQVHRAEAHNRAMLNEKTKREKHLREKEQGRKRKADDMHKWDERSQSIADEIEGMNKQKEAIRKRTQSEIQEIRDKTGEEQKECQQLEDENREVATRIKELQDEQRRTQAEEDDEMAQEADEQDRESDERFQLLVHQLSHQYNEMLAELQRIQQDNILARQRVAMLEISRRNAMPPAYSQLTPIEPDVVRRDKLGRRPRHTNSQSSDVSSPRNAGFEPFPSVNQQVTMSSPINRPAVFNSVNGMSLPITLPVTSFEPEDDAFSVTPMSPRGEALLPHDLLDNESSGDDVLGEDHTSLSALLHDSQPIPFPTMPPPSPPRHVRVQSPQTSDTSSPASFASPREEVYSESNETPDGKEEPLANGHRKLPSMSHLFSFNRQRGKTNDAPSLGSLKDNETHSLPRQMDDYFNSDSKPSRRLSYGNAWATQNPEPPKPVSSLARRAFMMAGIGKSASRNYDPFAPTQNSGGTSSPRAGSLYSIERMPRMSMEDALRTNWSYNQTEARNSPLAPDWASAISRSHSRRQSLYGSTTNLAFSHVNDSMDGDIIERHRDTRPLQAPIGTRPVSAHAARPETPKLNPAAPSFNMFGFGKNKDKTKEKDKKVDSPPESRKSKDAPSLTNTYSTTESRESLDRLNSNMSAGPSVDSTPAAKPTLLSKITRKASSNKFEWKRGSALFSRKEAGDTPVSATEEDVIGIPYDQIKSIDSAASTPTAEEKKASRTSLGSWNFMSMKRKKKEDLAASEISENGELVSESGENTDYDRDGDSVTVDSKTSIRT